MKRRIDHMADEEGQVAKPLGLPVNSYSDVVVAGAAAPPNCVH